MTRKISFGNARIFTGEKLRDTNTATANIHIPPRRQVYGNANLFLKDTGVGKKQLNGNARLEIRLKVYIGSSFENKVNYPGAVLYRFLKVQNELGSFEGKIFGVDSGDWDVIKEGNFCWFIWGSKVLFKGRIDDIKRESFGEISFSGFCMAVRARDFQTDRKTYTNVHTEQIVSERVNQIPNLFLGHNENFGRVTVRNEYGSELGFLIGLTNAVGYEWWVDQDGADHDIFNIKRNKGTGIPIKTYYTHYPLTNSHTCNYEKDRERLANRVTVLGRGDGINQASATTYNASDIYSELAEDIDDIQDTITLKDASHFPSSGEIRITEERITYTGKTDNTLTGCTRGTSGTTANYHRNTVFVETFVPLEIPKEGSSIHENGLKSETITIRSLIPERYNDAAETSINKTNWSQTAELIASRALKSKKDIIETITVYPTVPLEDMGIVDIGDTVTVVDPTVGLNKDMVIVEKEFVFDIFSARQEIRLVCATKQRNIIQELREEKEKADNINNFMQGATNIYSINMAENCSTGAANYMNMRYYLPKDAVAINDVKLNFKLKNYRAYHRTNRNESTHTHGIPSLTVPIPSLSSPAHSHSVSAHTSAVMNPESQSYSFDDLRSFFLSSGYNDYHHITPSATSRVLLWVSIFNASGSNQRYRVRIDARDTTGSWHYYPNSWGAETSITFDGNVAYFLVYAPGNLTDCYMQIRPSSSGSAEVAWTWQVMSRHTHPISAQTTSSTTVTTSSTTSSTPSDTTTAGSAHTHGITWGIQEQTLTNPSVDVYVGIDGGTMNYVGTYTTDQTNIDLTDHVLDIGPDNWINVQFRPNKNMRIEADAYVRIFINSE